MKPNLVSPSHSSRVQPTELLRQRLGEEGGGEGGASHVTIRQAGDAKTEIQRRGRENKGFTINKFQRKINKLKYKNKSVC